MTVRSASCAVKSISRGTHGLEMNSYFVNTPYCYRGAVADRTHCLASPTGQLHPVNAEYQCPPLLRSHYEDLYGYGSGYPGYSDKANDRIGGSSYYGDLDTAGHHLGPFSTSGGGQQLPLLDTTSSGIPAFQSRASAQSPLPTPLDFCRPQYMQTDVSSYQSRQNGTTGNGSGGGHLVAPFAEAPHPPAVPNTTEHAKNSTSGSGLGRPGRLDGGRSDCSRSPSGSSSRSSSPGGASGEHGQATECSEVVNGTVGSDNAAGGRGGAGSSQNGGNNASSQTTATGGSTCQFQQQIYPWMRRIHLANGTNSRL